MSAPRFSDRDENASEDTGEQQTRVAELVEQLTREVPADPEERTEEQQGRWLLAQLVDWHRREAKPKAWRYFTLREMDDVDLMKEKDALAGLEWLGSVTLGDGLITDRYSFPNQGTDIRADRKKKVHHTDRRIGTVVAIDALGRTIDIKKTTEAVGVHPTSIFVKEPYRKAKAQQDSLYRLGCWVRDNGISAPGPWRGVRNFLLRKPPELLDPQSLKIRDTEHFSR